MTNLNGKGVNPAMNSIKIPDKRPFSEDSFSLNRFAFSEPKISKILI